ncbi:unnamed protein product [Discula destructiva]
MADAQPSASILDSLNEAQCRAVCSEAATVAIMAGPGSGKTHTLTSRVVCLIDKVGYLPQNVIVATFTVKAAREMRERIGKALGGGRENKMVLGTFHSIARRYLAAYGKHIGLDQKFSIADDGDSRAIINRICKRLNLGIDPPVARAWISKRKAKGLKWKPTQLKRKRSGEATEGAKAFETCYKEYQEHLERSNLLDYDDLLVRCVELLQQRPACVSNVEAVLIDEYQDTNGIQYELMRLLAQKQNRITIVGDPDQSIYGWRSAEIGNLRRLFEDFPKTDQIALEENYRSSQAILDSALSVIQQDANRFQKVLKPVHDKGTRPTLRRLKTSSDEARWVVSEIRRIQLMSGQMMGHSDVAILLRSAALSRQIESALGKAGIPYKMVGGFKFYERQEIKLLLDYLRVIDQPHSNDALARIINTPKRGVGDTTIKALLEESEQSSQSLWTLLVKHCRGDRIAKTKLQKTGEQKISGELIRLILDIQKKIKQPLAGAPYGLVDIIDEVLTRLKFEKYLQDTHPDREDHVQRWANVQEFRALGSDFARELGAQSVDDELPEIEGLEQIKDTDVLTRFLANVSLASDAQKQGQDQEATPMVTISTIHAAKGLEWPVVFIPAAYNGSIPHARSEDTDEERRLLYVAMTRAKALLYISCPLVSTSYGGQSEVELSHFLEPVARSFSKVGPDIESTRLKAISLVLGRELPTTDSIYGALPGGFCPNDDSFPADPTLQDTGSGSLAQWDEFTGHTRAKRPRLNVSRTTESSEEVARTNLYTTTMDQSSAFTMNAQLGFVSAGAHQAALALAEHTDKRQPDRIAKDNKASSHGGQSTLRGFLKIQANKSSAATPTASNLQPPHAGSVWQKREAKISASAQLSVIDSVLTHHKIGSHQTKRLKPSFPKAVATGATEHYTPFSSSPPEASTPDAESSNGDGASAGVHSSSNLPCEPRSFAPRPALSFHNTTINKQKLSGGIKRPSGLAAPRDAAAALEKLRKPFRPLSINRR